MISPRVLVNFEGGRDLRWWWLLTNKLLNFNGAVAARINKCGKGGGVFEKSLPRSALSTQVLQEGECNIRTLVWKKGIISPSRKVILHVLVFCQKARRAKVLSSPTCWHDNQRWQMRQRQWWTAFRATCLRPTNTVSNGTIIRSTYPTCLRGSELIANFVTLHYSPVTINSSNVTGFCFVLVAGKIAILN